jgi:mRNA interferase MazF
MIRGAVYPVDLGDAKRGHEQRGRRLGLVISIEQNAWSTVTIIPTSTSAQPAVFRPDVIIAGRDTRILIDQIRTIDTAYVTGELVDYLSRDDMAQVEHSLSRYLGLLRLPRSVRRRSGFRWRRVVAARRMAALTTPPLLTAQAVAGVAR